MRRGGNRKGAMFRILRDIAPFFSLKRLVAGIGRMSILKSGKRNGEDGVVGRWEWVARMGYGRVLRTVGGGGRGSKGGAMGKFTVVGVLFEGECGIMNSRAVALSKCVRRIRRIGDKLPASGALYRIRSCSAKIRRHLSSSEAFRLQGMWQNNSRDFYRCKGERCR